MKSLRKGMEILKMLADHDGRLSVADICEQRGIPRSTAYRILVAACDAGMFQADPQPGFYVAGPEILRIGSAALGNLDIRKAAYPIMVELSRAIGHSVYLMGPSRLEAICLEKVEGNDGLQLSVNIGARRPMHTSGIAKVFLPNLSDDEIREYHATPLQRFTDRTIIDTASLQREIELTRQRGYGYSDGEYVPGARSLGLPIRDFRSKVVAALGVGGAAERLSDARLPFVVEQMMQAASSVSAALGHLDRPAATPTEKTER